MTAYRRAIDAENKLSLALGTLGEIASEIVGKDLTANLCNGGEIEFSDSENDPDEIALRIEDIISNYHEEKKG